MGNKNKSKKVKKTKKDKKKRKSRDRVGDDLKLLALAELGDARKVQEWLEEHGSRSIDKYEATGCTPLHQVGLYGYLARPKNYNYDHTSY